MAGAHRMWIKGWIPYEECYRVPLIVRWPGKIRPGSKTPRLAQTHDLGHTYLDAAGAAKLPYDDGRALQRFLKIRTDPTGRMKSCALIMAANTSTRNGSPSRTASSMSSTDSITTSCTICATIPKRCATRRPARSIAQADDMRARLYEMMARLEDPYGDVQARNSIGQQPDRYGAPRYLSRGKRL